MGGILIKNGVVITMDDEHRVFGDGAIMIDGDRIVAVGRTDGVKDKYKPEFVIDAKNKAVLPGLINTHTHLFQILMRSMGDDLRLFDWGPKVILPLSTYLQKDHCYYAALTGCLELIKSGCTCTVDNHYPFSLRGLADECLRAFVKIGIRGLEALGTQDTSRPWFPWPDDMIGETNELLNENVRLIEDWNGKENGRIHVWFGTGMPNTCTLELLDRAYDLSRKYRVGMCMHLHETLDEIKHWKEETGLTPIQYYHKKIKFLGENLLAIHCIWMDNEDIRILKNTGTKVSHNPVSNMYIASGVSPVPSLLKTGVTVSLGVDGAASNTGQDMFELMKSTALLHKVELLDPTGITAEEVLEMATIDGARAIGLENEIGSLEAGKKADIILVNLREANIIPINRPVSQLIYCAKSSNVDTVIIDGKIVMKQRVVKTVDEETVLEKTQQVADDLVRQSETTKWRERPWTTPNKAQIIKRHA